MPQGETVKSMLSPRELAEAVGVSESSIKRWANDGAVKVTRTAGGHRRIALEEAVRFIRSSDLTLVKPSVMGLVDLESVEAGFGVEAAGEQLYQYLLEGSGRRATGVLTALYLQGHSMAEIFDGPLQSAMRRLGEQWLHHEPGIFWEHRATNLAMQAVHRLRALQPPPEPGAPRAVGGAPTGDPYLLPSLAAAAVVQSAGFEAVNLGPETPVATLLEGVEDQSPALVWLSVSSAATPGRLVVDLEELLARLAARNAFLIVGGSAVDRLALPDHPSLRRGRSMGELEALAAEIAGSS